MRLFALPLLLGLGLPLAAQPSYVFSTLAGRGLPAGPDGRSGPTFTRPWSIGADATGQLYVSDPVAHTVVRLSPTLVATPWAGRAGVTGFTDGPGATALFGYTTSQSTTASSPTGPIGLAVTANGTVYLADTAGHALRAISPAQVVSTLAGYVGVGGRTDGAGELARFSHPLGVAVAGDGTIFVADTFNHVIRRVTPAGFVTTIAGQSQSPGYADGPGPAATFLHPGAITVDRQGVVYVADAYNLIRRLTPPGAAPTWTVSTLAGSPGQGGSVDGTGASARFGVTHGTPANISTLTSGLTTAPTSIGTTYYIGAVQSLAVDGAGHVLVADTTWHTLRRVTPAGVVTTIGGLAGTSGLVNGNGPEARFSRPTGLAFDAQGVLYVADSSNLVIRRGFAGIMPSIQTQPASVVVAAGQGAAFSVTAATEPAVTYQWFHHGTALPGATAATLTIASVGAAQAGSYHVTLTNTAGTVTSAVATLTLGVPPAFAVQPAAVRVNDWERIELSASVTGNPAPTLQWLRNGEPLPGATAAVLRLDEARGADAGTYSVQATNAVGTVTSAPAVVTVNTTRLVNLSIRTSVQGASPLIVGCVAAGGPKAMLVRAGGPALRAFGVSNPMEDPALTLYSSTGPLAANDNWDFAANAADVAAAAARAGAFAFTPGALDAALLLTPAEAALTAQIIDRRVQGGTVLLELYDATPAARARFVNVSTRVPVGPGDDLLVAGLVVTGNARRTLLVRAVGPTLASLGVTGALADPQLEFYAQGEAAPLAVNDNWGGNLLLVEAAAGAGAFPLALPPRGDAALLVQVGPGNYVAQVSGAGRTAGEVLLEIYVLP
jgi:hypothetical protein